VIRPGVVHKLGEPGNGSCHIRAGDDCRVFELPDLLPEEVYVLSQGGFQVRAEVIRGHRETESLASFGDIV